MGRAHRFVTIAVVAALVLAGGCRKRENPSSSKDGRGWDDSAATVQSLAEKQAVASAQARADSGRAAADSALANRSDPRAEALALRLVAALGGTSAYQAAPAFYFTYVEGDQGGEKLRRTHYWERATGRHRAEWTDRQGRKVIVIHTLGDSTGAIVVRDGAAVPPREARALREQAERAWRGDSTWLFLPYELRAAGRLDYGGTKQEGTKTWDVIDVAFDEPGRAPGNRAWVYVDRETGRIDRSARPAAAAAAAPAVTYEWQGWRPYGNILLADERRRVAGAGAPGSPSRIFFPDVAVPDSLPPSTFTSPEPVVMPAL
jgi:hypothetical protein